MRYFLRRRIPPFDRILLIESGSRSVIEKLLPWLYKTYGPDMRADLLSCYAGVPQGYREGAGNVYRVSDFPGGAGRRRLFRLLKDNRYSIGIIICSDEPILAKWKWALAAGLPAKIFIVNENADGFWFDRGNLRTICRFVLFRSGLSGAGAVRTLARIIIFPFTLLYLILYTLFAHLRRKVHV